MELPHTCSPGSIKALSQALSLVSLLCSCPPAKPSWGLNVFKKGLLRLLLCLSAPGASPQQSVLLQKAWPWNSAHCCQASATYWTHISRDWPEFHKYSDCLFCAPSHYTSINLQKGACLTPSVWATSPRCSGLHRDFCSILSSLGNPFLPCNCCRSCWGDARPQLWW